MARIREYVPQTNAQAGVPGGRRAVLGDFYDGSTEALGQAFTQISDTLEGVYGQMQRQEVAAVHADGATARADWTVALADRAAKAEPGDMSFVDTFQTDLQGYLAEWQTKYSTPAGRQAYKLESARFAADMTVRSSAAQAQSVGIKARQNYGQFLDSSRNTLVSDPTQFSSILAGADEALNGPAYSGIPAAARMQLQTETRKGLALSAVQGEINLNPDFALGRLKGSQWDNYLDADNKAALIRNAEVGVRAREVEGERLRVAQERAQEKKREATMDGFVARVFAETPDLSTQDVIKSDLSPAQKEHYIGLIERRASGEKITTNPQLVIDAWDRIHLPDGDPRKITDESEIDAFFGRGFTADNVRMLRAEMQGRRTEEGRMEDDLKKSMIAGARSALTGSNPMLGIRDPKGDEQFQRWLSQALPDYAKQRKAGKTPQELLNPDSKDYIGATINNFRRPIDVQMNDMINDRLSGGIPSDAPAEVDYKSADEVKAAYAAKKITREQALAALKAKGWSK